MSDRALKEFSSLEIEPLIADRPADPRDASRLLTVDRRDGSLAHRRFSDLPRLLGPGDMLVLNRSRVWKARLEALKPGGGRSEILLIAPHEGAPSDWTGLCRKARAGLVLDCPEGVKAECLARNPDGSFNFRFTPAVDAAYLARCGAVPLPRYILKARSRRGSAPPPDEDAYQTVYAEEAGAIAAPTAGFHFTPGLLSELGAAGVKTVFVTLHIGWGTFRPVRAEDPQAHVMMEEECFVGEEAAEAMNRHRARGGRLIAVGTSSMRTLETMSGADGGLRPGRARAGLFIMPGYRFKTAGAFITNLHVPDSAPLYMTAAFAGRELLFRAYSEAVKEKYRFYSYGDSMFIS